MSSRDDAWQLVNQWVHNQALIRHMRMVELAMRHYARLLKQDEELWGQTGLVHDFDYERFPDAPQHTREGAKILQARGYPESLIHAVLAHADWNQDTHPRSRDPLSRTLWAVDEMCGFIHAVALVRPNGIIGMKPKSVTKKMKATAFAAAVKRDDLHGGAEILAISLDQHIQNIIDGLTPHAVELELQGSA